MSWLLSQPGTDSWTSRALRDETKAGRTGSMLSQPGERSSPAASPQEAHDEADTRPGSAGPAKARKPAGPREAGGGAEVGWSRLLQEGGVTWSELLAEVVFLTLQRGWFRPGEPEDKTWGEVSLKIEP